MILSHGNGWHLARVQTHSQGSQEKLEVSGLSQGLSSAEKSFRRHLGGHLPILERLNKTILQHETGKRNTELINLPRKRANNFHP